MGDKENGRQGKCRSGQGSNLLGPSEPNGLGRAASENIRLTMKMLVPLVGLAGPGGGRETKKTTLSGGSLGSCIDEERSQLR